MDAEKKDKDPLRGPAAADNPEEAGEEGLEEESELTRPGDSDRAEELEKKAYGEDPPSVQFPG